MDVEFWPHWNRAKMAEEQAIVTEWPLWNIRESPWAATVPRSLPRKVRRKEQHVLRVRELTREAVLRARGRGVIDVQCGQRNLLP
jgi:hypothetical protein